MRSPHCDQYILCEVNSHDPNEKLRLANFKLGISKFSSMAAAWFISTETGTPFWTLFSVINDPYNCQVHIILFYFIILWVCVALALYLSMLQ